MHNCTHYVKPLTFSSEIYRLCVSACLWKGCNTTPKFQSINESQAQFAEPLTSNGISMLKRDWPCDPSLKGLPTSLPPHILTDSLPYRLTDGLGISVRLIQAAVTFQGLSLFMDFNGHRIKRRHTNTDLPWFCHPLLSGHRQTPTAQL